MPMYSSNLSRHPDTLWRSGDGKAIIYFLAAVSAYLLLLVIYYFQKNEAIKLVANGFAFSIFAAFVLKILLQKSLLRLSKLYVIALALIIFGMLCNAVENYDSTDIADYLKMALSPLFFLIGYFSLNLKEFRGNARKRLLLLTSVILVWGAQFKDGESISIFANRNNAALYAVVLSILFGILEINRRWVLLYLVLVAALFGTLGVFIAVALSIAIVHVKKRNIGYLTLLPIALFIWVSAMSSLPVLERLFNLSEGLNYLFSSGEIKNISRMSYGEFSEIMGGSSDVSFFFRIKHWMELLMLYASGSLFTIMFGHGVGSSVRDTTAALVPHNDYIRYLFECGVLPFIGFLILNLKILKDLGRTYISIPFITITIYFFSENLINNFLAMMLYYFLAGFVVAKTTAIAKKNAWNELLARQRSWYECPAN